MFHNNCNDVITTDDIQDVLGLHVGEEGGSKVATIKVLLDPAKDWQAVKEFFFHLTNGINHKTIGPVAVSESPADLPTVPSATPDQTTAVASTATTAETATASEETVKTSAVTPTTTTSSTKGEKGQ
jgi:hypothetical protein